MQPPRRCTTQFRCLELGVPRNALRPTDLRVSIPPTGRPPAGSPLFSSTGWVGLHLSSPDTRTQITRCADQRFNGGGGIVCELRVLHRRIVSRSLPLSDVRLWRCRSREVVSGSAIRVTEPEGDVLLTDREHLLSRLTPHSEHLDRAASTAHLRLATLADLARHRRGFGLRGFSAGWRSGADAARERQQFRPQNREGVSQDQVFGVTCNRWNDRLPDLPRKRHPTEPCVRHA